jgi:hypothetical protein
MVLEDSDVEMIVAELEVTVSRLLSLFDLVTHYYSILCFLFIATIKRLKAC